MTVTSTARRYSLPSKGASLATLTDENAKGIRAAVALLTAELMNCGVDSDFHNMFASRWQHSLPKSSRGETLASRTAWNLIATWCLAQASGQLPQNTGIGEAEVWFRGSIPIPCALLTRQISSAVLGRAENALFSISLGPRFWDLFPYILEEHGPGSRASILRDPSTATARTMKRNEGVFYTPSDVADYMVDHALNQYPGDVASARCLDPACGTGVFLVAVFRAARQRATGAKREPLQYIIDSLFGCDISGHALDAAAFVLLRECLAHAAEQKLSPWSAWHAIRMNLVEVDSLRIGEAAAAPIESVNTARSEIKNALANGYTWVEPQSSSHDTHSTHTGPLFGTSTVPLSVVFPEAGCGFDVMVGNPPYATLGKRTGDPNLVTEYRCLARDKVGTRANSFPLFIEMMWRLTVSGKSSSALVTPLAIAFHGGAQIEDCRHAIYWRGGRCQFAFFDREPHALFGEEVKTRNAILFRLEGVDTPKRGEPAEIETGPLRKWTSRTREYLFGSINFTSIGRFDITFGIPKLNGRTQAEAFLSLAKRTDRLSNWCNRIAICNPIDACQETVFPRIFVGGTAYNFLNVYRRTDLAPEDRSALSESPIQFLEMRSEREACAVFALLSSHLVFWLWHVLGDGFHVSRWLFDQIPFTRGSFTSDQFTSLSDLGAELWPAVQQHRLVSVNAGKRTIAFRPLAFKRQREAIDMILVAAAGLPHEFLIDLKAFVHQTVVVDPQDARRQHLQKYFDT